MKEKRNKFLKTRTVSIMDTKLIEHTQTLVNTSLELNSYLQR